MKKRRAHVWISGRVHHVFFRAYVRDMALRNKLSGWVRNLPDGRVEALFEGDADAVDNMIAWCHEGSPLSRVEKVEVLEEVFSGDLDTFSVKY